MARRTGRQRSQLPTCYYEGYLEKRSFKDKVTHEQRFVLLTQIHLGYCVQQMKWHKWTANIDTHYWEFKKKNILGEILNSIINYLIIFFVQSVNNFLDESINEDP